VGGRDNLLGRHERWHRCASTLMCNREAKRWIGSGNLIAPRSHLRYFARCTPKWRVAATSICQDPIEGETLFRCTQYVALGTEPRRPISRMVTAVDASRHTSQEQAFVFDIEQQTGRVSGRWHLLCFGRRDESHAEHRPIQMEGLSSE